MADRISKKKAPARETTVSEDIATIRKHVMGGAQVSHAGQTVDQIVTDAERGKTAPAKPSGPKYDASTGSEEHARNVATSPSSPGGITITAEERAHIREIAQAALKRAMSGK